jgi:hypothetical protein
MVICRKVDNGVTIWYNKGTMADKGKIFRCKPMKEAGIKDPDSQKGIDMCLHCPNPDECQFDDKSVKDKA